MRLKTVPFDFFKEYAKKHIAFFPAGSEYKWLEFVWSRMSDLNMTSYTNEIGRHTVIVRFLSLYEQMIIFICLVFGKKYTIAFRETVEELGISSFRLGQMAGIDHEIGMFVEADLNKSALRTLIKQQRGTVYQTIFRIFGGESGLLLSLLLLPKSELNFEEFDEIYEKYAPVMLNFPSASEAMEKLSVLSIQNGHHPLSFL